MATFYGQVKGSADTTASRQGSKASGIKASCQSWDGSLITEMWDWDGKLMVRLDYGEGSTFQGDQTLFRGTLDELRGRLAQ